jgi:thiamine kinase-like enzyme
MSDHEEIRALLASLPVGISGAAIVEKLDGGLNNRVFRIQDGADEFVMRVGAKLSGLPDIACEIAILKHAAKAGLGPEVVFSDADKHVLLLRYLEGRTWSSEDLSDPGNLEKLADLLRGVHTLPPSGHELDVAGIAECHYRRAHEREDLREFGSICLDITNQEAPCEVLTCCHNDVVAENVIAGDALWLIDWEWAADNEPAFDLASIVGYHDLTTAQTDTLLGAYSGGADTSFNERFREQLRLFDALQWLWLAARQVKYPDDRQVARLRTLQSRINP